MEEAPTGVEDLNPLVEGIRDVDPILGVDGQIEGTVELPVAGAEATPAADEPTTSVEYLYPVVVGIGDVDAVL